ncbi:hypothetical protein ACVRXQ_11220 [Streptococcus panodentis]|uniref:Uncharacterized protein n=1 Tax=Streptococcus panodentis TaxID=1581472 RepID=A0ABS5AYI7_9STRE|nr:hypothetical protein [Streptococcus panodentis]MBP2621647.1 hypothetical protein [Streptococcus panodentis]
MAIIYARVKMNDNIAQACKIVRQYTAMPVGKIKNRIEKEEVLLEYNYLDLDELKLMRTILNALINLGAKVYLFRETREVDMSYLNNTIESYEGIEEDRLAQYALMFDDED